MTYSSRYLEMWARIKELTPLERAEWMEQLRPAKGTEVDFKGVMIIDIDLLEALETYSSGRSQK